MARHKKQEANMKLKDAPQADQAIYKRTTTELKDEISELTAKKEELKKLIQNARNEKKDYIPKFIRRITTGETNESDAVKPKVIPLQYFYKKCQKLLSEESFNELKKENSLKIDLSDQVDKEFFNEMKEELVEHNNILPDLKMISIEEIDEDIQPSVLEFISQCFP
mmetsp:Transcript_20086/g.19707  ORF Transcript_20086/g.19707 Transcript_20086/m.19707 type:complete len:166 (+) Transcript_20086:306-803(+)